MTGHLLRSQASVLLRSRILLWQHHQEQRTVLGKGVQLSLPAEHMEASMCQAPRGWAMGQGWQSLCGLLAYPRGMTAGQIQGVGVHCFPFHTVGK